MSNTMLGVPVPAHRDHGRVSGRYAIQAPDAPMGSVLRVSVNGSTRFALVHETDGRRFFVDVDGVPLSFSDWDFASRRETEDFHRERLLVRYADHVELHGAPAFAVLLNGVTRKMRDDMLCAVVEILRERGKHGKASQVAAYRFEEG
jgi:hypothetical protein